MAQNKKIALADLAKPTQQRRLKKVVVELNTQTEYLTKKDLASWRSAWQYALEKYRPNRNFLYDIYTDVEADLHLTGCVGQRQGFVLNKSFKIVEKKSGVENPELTELFETPWFKQLMQYCLDSTYWGTTLIQLGDIIEIDGKPAFKDVLVVPRRHVVPEYGVIVKEQFGTIGEGYDYRNSDMWRWCIEVGQPNDLGLYLKCAQHTIPKKNMVAFWDQFGEIFGMPIRIAKTTSRDPQDKRRMEKMLADMGAAAWALFPEGTEIEIKETTRGDAFQVYDKRIERANSELSKGVLTQTMTTDNGSSLSQSEVHKQMLKNLTGKDADAIKDMVNFQLIPRMISFGFPLKGYRFDWDESIDYTPEEQVAFEGLILDNYDVDPQYFIDKYNVPVLKRKERNNQQLVKPFFD